MLDPVTLSDNNLNNKAKDDDTITIIDDSKPHRRMDSNIDNFIKNDDQMNSNAVDQVYILFNIGSPDVWYETQVQLYEKMSTSDGDQSWNDLTKSVPASLTTVNPEWRDEDLIIRYRTKDRVVREDFSLPPQNLCLMIPLKSMKDKHCLQSTINLQYDEEPAANRSDEYVKNNPERKSTYFNESNQRLRRVVIRKSRMVLSGEVNSIVLESQGENYYLKLPHHNEYHAQLDLEARADFNKLIFIGSSGRLTTVVSDTRNAGSTISLQVTNTGLAAAQFRTITRECTPPLGGGQYTEFGSEKVLIPPAHTRTVLLNLPLQEFFEDAICSREDPQLLCRNMDEPQLKAAGLSQNEGSRLVRDVCYPDDVTINIFVV
ncbi:uncharacterized protein LOC126971259 [Leptidea sinapis]|uniref:uncharacterized protein LOC126971259 n=1 Tax=Leptidea sinapis TaxID=189913 RepID=UPI0021C2AE2F|nr:uncharacterized protein LOC126971259 [Leptidea sinapis]